MYGGQPLKSEQMSWSSLEFPELAQWASLAQAQSMQAADHSMDTAPAHTSSATPSLFAVQHTVCTVLAQRYPLAPRTQFDSPPTTDDFEMSAPPHQREAHHAAQHYDMYQVAQQAGHQAATMSFGCANQAAYQAPPHQPCWPPLHQQQPHAPPNDLLSRMANKRSVLGEREQQHHLPPAAASYEVAEACLKRQKLWPEQAASAALPPLDEDGSRMW